MRSLFAIKLFKTSSNDIIQECRAMFDVKPVSDLILNRRRNFLTNFVNNCDNVVCGVISIMAKRELDCLSDFN